jgi:hypothetical protein
MILTTNTRMGLTAAIFMALNTYLGWWYQRLVRHRFQRAVKAMHVETGTTLQAHHTRSESATPFLEVTLGRPYSGGFEEHEMTDLGDKKQEVEAGKGGAEGTREDGERQDGSNEEAPGAAIASGRNAGRQNVASGGIVKRNTGGLGGDRSRS